MPVRDAEPERDGAACAAIYAPYVTDTAVSFEDVAPSAEELAARIAATRAALPWLVWEDDRGDVVGYACASRHRQRAAYRWAVDVAVYVDAAHHARGAGRALYEALFERLREQGYVVACAGIALPNDASVGLHRALGFEHVGTHPAIGYKAGAWRDVAWWQLRLADAGDPPDEPRPPRRRR